MTAREWWKIWWRQLRITRRESLKTTSDMLIFGTGCVEIGKHIPDFIRHVPIQEVSFRQ